MKNSDLKSSSISFSDFSLVFPSLENLFKNQYGLFNGKSGLTLIAFLLYKMSEDSRWHEKAINLLDEVSDNISQIKDLSFAEGLSGIGWSIEWIVQNGFMNANTDEILEELDDIMYKAVVFSESNNLSLEQGTLGFCMFFHKRLLSNNLNSSRYRRICNIECLVILTDEVYEKLVYKYSAPAFPIDSLAINEISQSLRLMQSIFPTRINYEKVKKTITFIIKLIRDIASNEKIIAEPELIKLWKAFQETAASLNNHKLLAEANYLVQSMGHSNGTEPDEYTLFKNSILKIIEDKNEAFDFACIKKTMIYKSVDDEIVTHHFT